VQTILVVGVAKMGLCKRGELVREVTIIMAGTEWRVKPAKGVVRDVQVLNHAKVSTDESHTSTTELARLY
jgi:hypothetical protein